MSDTTFMKMNADRYIRMALEEDITSEDISTNCVMPEYQKGQVDLICKQDGVICGLWVFQRVFELLDDTVTFDMKVKEGDFVHAGDLMAVVTGDIRTLLSGERTALNYLQRMSGIATYTHEIAQLLEGSHTTLLDTRKTTPNMRLFEKYAVKVGGGSNHRYNLSDVLQRQSGWRKSMHPLYTRLRSRWRHWSRLRKRARRVRILSCWII